MGWVQSEHWKHGKENGADSKKKKFAEVEEKIEEYWKINAWIGNEADYE